MATIYYKDRATGELKKEKVYGKFFLEALYGSSLLARLFSVIFLPIISHIPFFSHFYGRRQKGKKSRLKIIPFIRDFHVDTTEFVDPVESFSSFNDFFIRKLKPNARPIASGDSIAVLPADGRFLAFQDLTKVEGFYVKGEKFDLRCLLRDEFLFDLYKKGSMLIARLCPTDYHRFHFPCTCTPGKSQLINGPLFSVNPIALRKHISILNENKRMLTLLESHLFGKIAYIEVGATCVGSIQQTFTPNKTSAKGEEKGYFEFGGSCLILLFEPGRIQFDQDLIEASSEMIETYAKMGEPLGFCK
ncbi:MAG: phosphatidylserine decarboxylase [Chlamydiia bacterium]|nr:phosphatidylserine decarboxylase [Chlamydiia bacterium]